ncbi:MAG: hypothetical protein GY822_24485 [Deltaproteobacteria bacterium]|nr:hypothetical protein [Deltaproteobacteria bacterium]
MRHLLLLSFFVSSFLCACWPAVVEPDAGSEPDAENDAGGFVEPDAGSEPDAGVSGEPEVPLNVPLDTWTYVTVEGARCGDGSPVGYAINPTEASDEVYFFFEGGGACWDDISCNMLQTATYVKTGITEAAVLEHLGRASSSGQFNRDDDTSPMREKTYIYFPHCTGDLYTGSNANSGIGVEFVGYTNIGLFLDDVVPYFANASRIIVSGSSAGGYGAAFNYARIQERFPNAKSDLLVDSAPAVNTSIFTAAVQNEQRAIWGLTANLPAGCGDDCSDQEAFFLHLLDAYPESNFAVVASLGDATLRGFAQLGSATPLVEFPVATYTAGIQSFYDVAKDRSNFRLYAVDSEKHVFFYDDPFGSVTSEGVRLVDFLDDALDDNATWAHVLPAAITP